MRRKISLEKEREERIKRRESLYRNYTRYQRQVKAHFYQKEGETSQLGSN